MADFRITINNREKLEKLLANAIPPALDACGLFAETEAKKLLTEKKAVDTGNLRNSVTYVVESDGTRDQMAVGTNVEYAPYVENGTSRMKARPYIRPSIADNIDKYAQIIRQYLERGGE